MFCKLLQITHTVTSAFIFFLITKKMRGEEGLGSLPPPPPLKTIAATPLVRLVKSKVKSEGGEGRKRVKRLIK